MAAFLPLGEALAGKLALALENLELKRRLAAQEAMLGNWKGSALGDAEAARRIASLSAREAEVLRRIVEGKPSVTIAERVFLSVKSVESYRSRGMKKLGVGGQMELAKFAVRYGLGERA